MELFVGASKPRWFLHLNLESWRISGFIMSSSKFLRTSEICLYCIMRPENRDPLISSYQFRRPLFLSHAQLLWLERPGRSSMVVGKAFSLSHEVWCTLWVFHKCPSLAWDKVFLHRILWCFVSFFPSVMKRCSILPNLFLHHLWYLMSFLFNLFRWYTYNWLS